jgi:hypothetical protein
VKPRAEYAAWWAMVNRCSNPKHPDWPNYGGRGITVSDRWRQSFESFLDDMGPRPAAGYSLDRINNDGPYAPGNCRWATKREQARNMRTNTWLELDGQRKLTDEWAEVLGMSERTIYRRLRAGETLPQIAANKRYRGQRGPGSKRSKTA